ncbi:MAG TPA: hypothetical protein EYP98_17565, partial [Planctomycetes bacterium]|nr:hypothetical protein [Planctomycetota bacterium]
MTNTGRVQVRPSIAVAVLPVLAACAGIFQHAAPDQVMRYAVTEPVRELRVGSAERDITPLVGEYMGGFDIARTSTAIGSPLKVRALVIETGNRRFAILGIDSLGLMRGDVDFIKSGLGGFANGDVFVCS